MKLVKNSVKLLGRSQTLKAVGVQLLFVLICALIMLFATGFFSTQAFLVGGFVVVVGNLLFGWILFPLQVLSPRMALRRFYMGELLKWLWVILAVTVALGVMKLKPVPLLFGFAMAYLGFWLWGLGLRLKN